MVQKRIDNNIIELLEVLANECSIYVMTHTGWLFWHRMVFCSLEVDNLLAFEQFLEASGVEAGSCDHKAGNSSGTDRFLSLLLEFEGNFVLVDFLDGLRGHCSALFFDWCKIDLGGITEKTNNKVASNEADTLTGVLELFSELRQE